MADIAGDYCEVVGQSYGADTQVRLCQGYPGSLQFGANATEGFSSGTIEGQDVDDRLQPFFKLS